jgi:nucleotide-binding universal stress UspA family protein
MFKKTLVAFDGSAHSEEALRKAVEIAGESGQLTILSVAPPPSSLIATGQVAIPLSVNDIQKEIDRSWSSQLDQSQVGGSGVTPRRSLHAACSAGTSSPP